MIGWMLVAEVALELGVNDETEHVEMLRLAVGVSKSRGCGNFAR